MRTGKILGALEALTGFAQGAKPLPAWARDRMTERYTITNKFAGGTVHVESVPSPAEAIAGTNLRRERRAARWAKSSRGSGTPPSHIAPWIAHA